MTKKEMFANIATLLADNAEVVDFCNHEIEILSRKRGSSKPTKTQIENEGIKAEILNVLAGAEAPMTVGEIVKALDGDYTSQKISALCRQLVLAEAVVKATDKKVSRFSVA